jgi:L-ascorbate metabolism protein UlaG (beta-lactamase superfamily)
MRKLIVLAVCFMSTRTLPAEVGIEYIGHACFVVESPQGIRVVIDPFNSNRWLGYQFPESVEANAILVTHPHYDHDATYYWGNSVPAFRKPGHYRVGDVTIRGFAGRHADPYGTDFEQSNVIWLLETGGMRIVHLGDSGPMTRTHLAELGRVDVLMIPADGQNHILTPDQISDIREALQPSLTIPMHYRLEGFLDLPRSLGSIEPWIEKQEGVVRLETHEARLNAMEEPKVLVFPPSPELRPWSAGVAEGWQKLDEARELIEEDPAATRQAEKLIRQAHESATCIVFAFQWARTLHHSGKPAEAKDVLERALVLSARDDWEYRMRARALLAKLYLSDGRTQDAAEQYRVVVQNSRRTKLLDEARAFRSRE